MRVTKSAAVLFIVGALMLGLATSGTARPQAVDMQIDIAAGPGSVPTPNPLPPVPNGGTVTVRGLKFVAGTIVSLIAPEAAKARISFELPPGLSWGTDYPDPTERCTSTPSTADCQSAELEPITGLTDEGWLWDIVAAAPGRYVLRAAILDSSPTDAVPANNASSVTVVVLPVVSAGSVALAPARPRAGARFAATVRVSASGNPAAPSGVRCRATLAGAQLRGSGKAASGAAVCTFRTSQSARGKLVRGSVSFSAAGTSFVRRFSTRLR